MSAGYRAEGYRRFQLKVGADPQIDIERIRQVSDLLAPSDKLIADAKHRLADARKRRAWSAALMISMSISSSPASRMKNASRSAGARRIPLCWTKNVDGIDMLMRGHADQAMDVVNIKISKFGGLTKAGLARDLCVEMGVAMTIEDSWGGDIYDSGDRPSGA